MVEVTEDFEAWWDRLNEEERISVDGMIRVLEAQGPSLGPPYSTDLAGSRYEQLRQLRVPHRDHVICVIYVCDESRIALVLLTGATTGTEDEACPPHEIEAADSIYNTYLSTQREHN